MSVVLASTIQIAAPAGQFDFLHKTNKIRAIMRKSVCTFFVLWLTAVCAQSAIIVSSSPSQVDVSNAVNSAIEGDIVRIPAGTATWNSTLTVTNAITIAGAGTDATVLTGGGFFLLKPGKDRLTRITGIHFDEPDWTPSYLITCIGNCKQFRIDRCKFSKGTHVLNFGIQGAGGNGPAYGVVDHNTFFDCNTAIYVADVEDGDAAWGDAAWSRTPIVPGTTNAVCIEDNLFLTDNLIGNALNNNNQMLYGWNGARAVFRMNVQIDTGTSDALSIDAHGAYSPSEELRGTVMFEVYSNVFDVNVGYGYFFLRGGMHLWFNNTVYLTNGDLSTLIQLADERTAPVRDYITNSYFWGNTLNGTAWTGPLATRSGWISGYSGAMNRNYFMHPPRPGQAFYPYTPLAYPHPLASGPGFNTSSNALSCVANFKPAESGPAVLFLSTGSFSRNGTAITYLWTFGDGTCSTLPNPTHTFTGSGTYHARLMISDGFSTVASKLLRVTVPP